MQTFDPLPLPTGLKSADDLAQIEICPAEWEVMRGYLRRILSAPVAKPSSLRLGNTAYDWLRDHADKLRLKGVDFTSMREHQSGSTRPRDSIDNAFAILNALPRARKMHPSPLTRRLRWITDTLRLEPLDSEALGVMVRSAMLPAIHQFFDTLTNSYKVDDETHDTVIAGVMGVANSTLRHRLRGQQPLLQLGLVENRSGGDYAPSQTVLNIVRMPTVDPDCMQRALVGRSEKSSLGAADFEHLGELGSLATALVKAALSTRATGVNLLIHGANGVGKTEFARVLAETCSAHAVFVGESDDGSEPSRASRIAHLALANAIAARTRDTILVVDEADDIFTSVDADHDRVGSKVFVTRLVERSTTPTIWITNNVDRLGQAVVRRMSLAIEFARPSRAVRQRIVAARAASHGLAMSADDIATVARLEAAPAIIDAGLRAAAMTGAGAASAITCARSLLRATGHVDEPAALTPPVAFDPALSSADVDLVHLVERIAASGDLALSFCLSGPPGTGKSAFARHLAARLGLEVYERRASDLLSKWVGGTERLIAEAFTNAVQRRAVLIIDEADSLLRDRALAKAVWEVSQVNEMLRQMEEHPMPFIATTNLVDALDPATTRRFTFKVKFRVMNEWQAREAFLRSFNLAPPPPLDLLGELTPGDFALVARKARVLGVSDPEALVDLLAAEVSAKPGGARGAIGFARAA